MTKLPDIDIDFANRDQALEHLDYKTASIIRNGVRTKHNTGIYVQEIPSDHTGMASIDYEQAEELGYFKIDLLNNSAYQGIDTLELRDHLINMDPDWTLLEREDIVKQLPHIAEHFDLVSKLKPKSVLALAAVLAIIRPAKRYLKDADWDTIFDEVWLPPKDGSYYFKKSHSIAYSLVVVMRLNYIYIQSILNK